MSHKCKTKACKVEVSSGWYCMSCTDKRDRYCPDCLGHLDNSDSCWIKCEYESNTKNPPLTKHQMFELKIVKNTESITRKRIAMIRLLQENVGMRQELEALSER